MGGNKSHWPFILGFYDFIIYMNEFVSAVFKFMLHGNTYTHTHMPYVNSWFMEI